MINKIIESISISLDAEFGNDYTIIQEVSKQDLKEPCFFISCIDLGIKHFFGRRYFRKNLFAIQYFPKSECVIEECISTAERLFSCLEYIIVSGDLLRGTKMHYEIVDGILNFWVNYDCFIYEQKEEEPLERIEIANYVKE